MVAAMNDHPLETDLEGIDILGWILVTSQGIRVSQDFIGQLVAVARQRGVSWRNIGRSLSVTKQAAAKRYTSDRTSTVVAQVSIEELLQNGLYV